MMSYTESDHDVFLFNRLEDIKDRKALVRLTNAEGTYTGYILGVYMLDTLANEYTDYDGEKSRKTYRTVVVDLERSSIGDPNYPLSIVLPYDSLTNTIFSFNEIDTFQLEKIHSQKDMKKIEVKKIHDLLKQISETKKYFAEVILFARHQRRIAQAIVTLNIHMQSTTIEEIPVSIHEKDD